MKNVLYDITCLSVWCHMGGSIKKWSKLALHNFHHTVVLRGTTDFAPR